VEVEHSYSLSNIEKLYHDESDVTSFHLFFPTITTVLQADTGKEAREWVEKIQTGENDSMVSLYKSPSASFDNCKYY
jgi:hypothetical protein